MHSADCGLAPEIFTAGILLLCRHTACVSLQLRETYGLMDSEYIRPNRWACLYLELHRMSLYPSLDLRMACYSGAVKIMWAQHGARRAVWGGVHPPLPPCSTTTALWPRSWQVRGEGYGAEGVLLVKRIFPHFSLWFPNGIYLTMEIQMNNGSHSQWIEQFSMVKNTSQPKLT